MQATGLVASGVYRSAHHKRSRKQKLAHGAAPEESTGPQQGGLGYLTQILPVLGRDTVEFDNPTVASKKGNYLTRSNYRSLLSAAENYARLVGKPLGHVPGVNNGACIADLYYKLQALEPDINLNIGASDGKLHFVFWDSYDFAGYTLYWLCIEFIERLTPKVREAAVSLLRLIREKTGMALTNDCCDIESVIGYLRERGCENEDERERALDEAFADSYCQGGDVYNLMEELLGPSESAEQMDIRLKRLRPRDEYNRRLLELIREGYTVLSGVTRPLLSYRYDPFYYDGEVDEFSLEIDRLIRFMYADDMMSEELAQMLNDEVGNGAYEELLSTTLVLGPDTKERFSMDTAPKEILAYLEKLLYFTNGYIDDGKNK